MSAHFHSLTIREIRRETLDAVSIAFDVPEGLEGAFHFQQGQYLTLRAVIAGEDTRRSYSICTGEKDGELRVAVKEVPGGVFSTFANRALRPGDVLDVLPPMGRFGTKAGPKRSGHAVAFAAGSGITPIMSIIRTRLTQDPDSRFTLFYGNRNSASILFKETLEDLKDRFLGRLSVQHVLSREAQDISLLNGRLDADKISLLMRVLGDAQTIDDVFLCGPEGMIAAGRTALVALGVEDARIHVELFTTGEPGAKRQAAPQTSPSTGVPLSITIDGAGHSITIREGESVLEAAERAGLDLPYSCRGGMCCTCRAKVISGESAMEVNFSLEPWELAAGYVLTCQCHAKGDHLSVDFDHV